MKAIHYYQVSIRLLEALAPFIGLVLLRIILAWEFGEAGFEKFNGTNWFADVSFPFPFSLLTPNLNWSIAMWFEILGAIALFIGLGTRFFALSLSIVTLVAIFSVHWPEHWHTWEELAKGYRILDEDGDGFGNYKLPIIYLGMLITLIFNGPGKLSLDHLIKTIWNVKT